jgi:hypothetical protein
MDDNINNAEEGESLIFLRKEYEIVYMRPCKSDKKKKMASIRLRFRPRKNFHEALKKSNDFEDVRHFPSLGLVKMKLRGKDIMIMHSGEINIREAADEEDVIKTADLIVRSLKP